MPLECVEMVMPDGSRALVRMEVKRLRCDECGAPGKVLCDYPLEWGKTCDRGLCPKHATHAGPDVDYCPGHAELVEMVRG